jgi:Flp pilus assembly protein TadG
MLFRRCNLWSDRDGAAMVEMAAMLPFLLFLGCGVFEFGAFFYQYQMVQAGIRDAARYLARVSDPTTSTTPCAPTVLTANESAAKNIAVTGVTSGGTNRVSWFRTSDITISYIHFANPPNNPLYRGPPQITVVQVSTNPSYPGVGFLSFLGLGSGLTVNLRHQERCIGSG